MLKKPAAYLAERGIKMGEGRGWGMASEFGGIFGVQRLQVASRILVTVPSVG